MNNANKIIKNKKNYKLNLIVMDINLIKITAMLR